MTDALADLLRWLKAQDYHFTAVTPATHERVLARGPQGPATLRDIFGWSRRFRPDQIHPEALRRMHAAGVVAADGGRARSRVRVASLGGDLFLHSPFPTDSEDAVFFGPDTYRFARFIAAESAGLGGPARIIDMGAGSGAGGLSAARLFPGAALELVDVNPAALALARANAAAAGIAVSTTEAQTVPKGADLVLANPPYMMDADARAYRDGGGLLGGGVALAWTQQALAGMRPGGTLLLYTGAGVSDGEMPLVEAIEAACAAASAACRIEELDPDVFGEELDEPAYAKVERIAAIGVTVTKSG